MKNYVRICCGLILAIIGVLATSTSAWVKPVGDSTPAGNAASCTNILGFLNDGKYHRCSRLGVAWFKESKDPSVDKVSITGPGATTLSCPGIDGYYRLSYLSAKLVGEKTDFTIEYEGGDSYVYSGALNVSLAESPNTILREDRNAIAWATANAHFLVAEDYGVTRTTWTNTAAFCYDSSWDCEEDDSCPEDDPKDPEPGSSNGYFWSISKVEAVSGGDVPSGIEATSEVDGNAEIRFSTDQESVQIKFTHSMGYTNTTNYGSNDQVADATTKWTAYQSSDSGTLGNSIQSDQSFTAKDGRTKHTTTVKNTPLVTIELNPGVTKTVCQTIKYSPKYIKYTKTSHAATATDAAYDEYTSPTDAGNPSSGQSSVCVTVSRPSKPDSGDGTGGTGSTDSNLMFAGENANISWNVSGGNIDTRRLREWQAVVYRIPVTVPYSASLHTGTRGPLYGNQSSDVCAWYHSHDYCDVVGGRSENFGDEGKSHDYTNKVANIVVPDTVGYKYCNSFGYRYEYWWFSSSEGGWHKDKSYWRIHDASCRTIAKKPMVAIWNGSLLTERDAISTAALRFNRAKMGLETSEVIGGSLLYASWSEYLAVVHDNVTNFGSGASFANGSDNLNAPKSSGPLDTNNSPLTIANKNQLGGSGIFSSSAYRTRLSTFLESRATILSESELGAMSNVTSTQILRRNGDLKLTDDITISSGNYESIYHVPQVVIFVHGNLEITSNVKRIDAWLVVDGSINTCSEFVLNTTESDADGRASDICSNQLVFNGPVLASKVILNRSFGADPVVKRLGTFNAAPAKQNAAEVFNLRTDTYLWARAQAGRYHSSYTESYTRELPPRY